MLRREGSCRNRAEFYHDSNSWVYRSRSVSDRAEVRSETHSCYVASSCSIRFTGPFVSGSSLQFQHGSYSAKPTSNLRGFSGSIFQDFIRERKFFFFQTERVNRLRQSDSSC